MHIKAVEVLIPIWMHNIPPTFENENDYFLKIESVTQEGKQTHFYVVIQWCPYDNLYSPPIPRA
jgi:hypothetical protein